MTLRNFQLFKLSHVIYARYVIVRHASIIIAIFLGIITLLLLFFISYSSISL